MDANRALTDLIEICSQIEHAIVFDKDGAVLASTLDDSNLARSLTDRAVVLLAALDTAGEAGHGSPAQAELALAEGSVFLSSEKDLRVLAISAADPISGLVLYDLSRCLRQIVGVRARRRRKATSDGGSQPKRAKTSEKKPAPGAETEEGEHGTP